MLTFILNSTSKLLDTSSLHDGGFSKSRLHLYAYIIISSREINLQMTFLKSLKVVLYIIFKYISKRREAETILHAENKLLRKS